MTTSQVLVALLAGGFGLLGVVAGFLFRTLEARTQRRAQFDWEARQREFQAHVDRSRHLFDARQSAYVTFRLEVGQAREEFRAADANNDQVLAETARNRIWDAYGPVQLMGGEKVRTAALAILRHADALLAKSTFIDESSYNEQALDFMEAARNELIGLTATPVLSPVQQQGQASANEQSGRRD